MHRRRLRGVASHVCAHEASAGRRGEDCWGKGAVSSSAAAESQLAVCDMGDPRHEWTKRLRGTIWERHGGDLAAAEAELAESGAVFAGSVHERLRDMATEYGGNFCIARTSAGNGVGPQLEPWLVVSDPKDAVEISKRHLKKARIYQYVPPLLTPCRPASGRRAAPPRSLLLPACRPTFMGEGLFGLSDTDEWRAQRHQVVAGLLPLSSLEQNIDVIAGSASEFVGELRGQCESGAAAL